LLENAERTDIEDRFPEEEGISLIRLLKHDARNLSFDRRPSSPGISPSN